MYRGKVLCPECYKTRLPRKAAKKARRKAIAKLANAPKDVKEYNPLMPTTKEDKKDEVKFSPTSDQEETK